MLTAFTVENYRSFADKTRIELRPLTLLFGYNNAGKSALVRVLPLIADSMKPDLTGPLDLASAAVRRTTFAGLVSKNGETKTIRLGLELPDQTAVEYAIAQPEGSLFQSLTTVNVSHPKLGSATFELLPQSGTRVEYRLLWEGKPTEIIYTRPFVGLALSPWREVAIPDDADHDRVSKACDALVANFSMASAPLRTWGLFWLGSLRRYPDPILEYLPGSAPPRLQPDGSKAAEILAVDFISQGPLLGDVSGWYEHAFQRRLVVVQREDSRFSLMLEPMDIGAGMAVPVADTGEGMAQVLPVLLAAAMARRGENGDPRLLAFEQPELHLHTAAHAALAEHLCKLAATEDPPQMLIETHSENFLLEVQLQVARKVLPRERVLIYWIYQIEDGLSQVQRIELDDEGYARGFPGDVFDKDVELSRLLIRAREHTVA